MVARKIVCPRHFEGLAALGAFVGVVDGAPDFLPGFPEIGESGTGGLWGGLGSFSVHEIHVFLCGLVLVAVFLAVATQQLRFLSLCNRIVGKQRQGSVGVGEPHHASVVCDTRREVRKVLIALIREHQLSVRNQSAVNLHPLDGAFTENLSLLGEKEVDARHRPFEQDGLQIAQLHRVAVLHYLHHVVEVDAFPDSRDRKSLTLLHLRVGRFSCAGVHSEVVASERKSFQLSFGKSWSRSRREDGSVVAKHIEVEPQGWVIHKLLRYGELESDGGGLCVVDGLGGLRSGSTTNLEHLGIAHRA